MRKLAIVLGSLVTILVLLVVGLWLFFPSERIKGKIVSHLEKSLGVPVKLEKLSVRFLPELGITLSQLELNDKPSVAFPKISLDSVHLGLSWAPLFRKEIEITDLTLVKPSVQILQAEEKPQTEDKPVSKEEKPLPFSLQLKKFQIVDGHVQVLTKNEKPLLEISGLNEELKASISSVGEIDLEGITEIKSWLLNLPVGNFGRNLPIRFEKKFSYSQSKDELSVQKANLALGRLPLKLTGLVSKVSTTDREGELKLEGGPGEIEEILGFIPIQLLPPSIKDVQSSGRLALKVDVKGKLDANVPFFAELNLSNGFIRAPEIPHSIENIHVSLKATPSQVHLSDFRAQTKNSHVEMNATVNQYRAKIPKAKGSLLANIDLEEWKKMAAHATDLKARGGLGVKLTFDGHLEPGQSILYAAVGSLNFQSVSLDGKELPKPINNLQGIMGMERGNFFMKDFGFRMGESDLTISGNIVDPISFVDETSTKPIKFSFSISGKRLNLDELLPATKPKEEAETEKITLPAPFMRLHGEAKLALNQLRVNKLEVENLKGALTIKEGILTLKDFGMKAFGGDMLAKGKVNYQNPNRPGFDMSVQVKEVQVNEFFSYAENLNKLAHLGTFLKGKFSAKTDISGSLDDKMQLNLEDLNSLGSLQMKGGSFSNHPVQNQLAGFLKAPKLEVINVRDWFAPFKMKNGRLEFSKLKLGSNQLNIEGDGWQALDGGLNMNLNVDLPKSWAKGVQETLPKPVSEVLFGTGQGNIDLPFTIAGKFTSPKVSLNESKLTQEAKVRGQQKLAAEKQKVEKKLQTEAQKSLQKSIQSTKDAKSSKDAKKSVKDTSKDLEKKAKETLKNLF